MSIEHRSAVIHVIQGEFATSDKPGVVLTAVLGSCVAACVFDATIQLGGMNHFLLPERKATSSNPVVFGAQSMELLINELLKRGARKQNLQAKLFGGANVLSGLTDIGAQNADFAERFLKNEGIPCVSSSLRGNQARRVRFWPAEGRAVQKFIGEKVVEPQKPLMPKPDPVDIEFF